MKSDFFFHGGNLLIIIQFIFLSDNKQDVQILNRWVNRLNSTSVARLKRFSRDPNFLIWSGLDFIS